MQNEETIDRREFQLGGRALPGIIRQTRRLADLSQRQLARRVGLAPSTIAAYETGDKRPNLDSLRRILNSAGLTLMIVGPANQLVMPLETWGGIVDLAGRRFPAHLDTIVDPAYGEWWGDVFGLARPPETFRRNRAWRDYERERSRRHVRGPRFRLEPPPVPPRAPWIGRQPNPSGPP
jgi:transcriptional regulator with XRE-family HTH domain